MEKCYLHTHTALATRYLNYILCNANANISQSLIIMCKHIRLSFSGVFSVFLFIFYILLVHVLSPLTLVCVLSIRLIIIFGFVFVPFSSWRKKNCFFFRKQNISFLLFRNRAERNFMILSGGIQSI